MPQLPLLFLVLLEVSTLLSGSATASASQSMELASLKGVDPLAVCADGTSAGFYWEEGAADSTLWVVYLDGGAWCYSDESCSKRCNTPGDPKCSSRGWPSVRQRGNGLDCQADELCGILSPPNSVELQGAKKVFVPYCSADAFLGDGDAFNLHMRGARIVRALLQYLVNVRGLGAAGKEATLLLAGGSAGARGVLVHLDYAASFLRESSGGSVEVRGFLDSALWVDIPPARATVSLSEQALAVYKGANVSNLNSDCLAKHQAEGWKCIFGEYGLPFVETPYLLVQSQSDLFQLLWNLDEKPNDWKQLAFAEAFAKRVVSVVEKVRSPSHRVLSWSCWSHDLSLSSRFSLDSVDGTTMEIALQKFLGLDGEDSSSGVSWVDDCSEFACGGGCHQDRQAVGAVGVGHPWPEPDSDASTTTEVSIQVGVRTGSSDDMDKSMFQERGHKVSFDNVDMGIVKDDPELYHKLLEQVKQSVAEAAGVDVSEVHIDLAEALDSEEAAHGASSKVSFDDLDMSIVKDDPEKYEKLLEQIKQSAADAAGVDVSEVHIDLVDPEADKHGASTTAAEPASKTKSPEELILANRTTTLSTSQTTTTTSTTKKTTTTSTTGTTTTPTPAPTRAPTPAPTRSPTPVPTPAPSLAPTPAPTMRAISMVDFRSRMLGGYPSQEAAIEAMGADPINRFSFSQVTEGGFDPPLSRDQSQYVFGGLDVNRDGFLTSREIAAVMDYGRFYPDPEQVQLGATGMRVASTDAPDGGQQSWTPAITGLVLCLLLLPATYLAVVVLRPQITGGRANSGASTRGSPTTPFRSLPSTPPRSPPLGQRPGVPRLEV